ncbi:MAG: membrane protein insertion efficiency factor YidD [Candidatus Cloacimonetes bacterium]|nr:membrane protein insertion efficiency factor YidD [Candidatus Cloacimonadota bacterium]
MPNVIALFLIRLYRAVVSPFLSPSCRFTPTCSVYAAQAFQKYGFFKALKLSLFRIMRCHPWHPGGHDPLP